MRRLFLLLYGLSGAAGLIYEVLWTRQLTLLMGHTTAAASTVLAAFMGGLAIGAVVGGRIATRIHERRALQVYGVVEIGIAAAAALVPALLGLARPLLSTTYADGSGEWFGLTRVVVSLLAVTLPAAAMGATLPLAARWYLRSVDAAGAEAGDLYAGNTIGAAAGTALASFLFIPALGLRGTFGVAAALNIVAALGAWGIAQRDTANPAKQSSGKSPAGPAQTAGAGKRAGASARKSKRPTSATRRAPVPLADPRFIAAATVAVTGFAALVSEVVWTRVLALVIGPTTYAFGLMLTTFITGLGLGSWAGARLMARVRDAGAWLGLLVALFGLMSAVALWRIGGLPVTIADAIGTTASMPYRSVLWRQALVAASLLLPVTIVLGALFPIAVRVVARSRDALARDLSMLYAANTVGAIAGALTAGFIFIPWLGLRTTIVVVVTVAAVAAVAIAVSSRMPRLRILGLAAAGVAGIALAAAAPRWDRALLSSGAYKYASYLRVPDVQTALTAGTLEYYKEGSAATVTVRRAAGARMLAIDGKIDASNASDMLTQRLLAHLPLLLHPRPSRVGIIGLGSGVTLGSALRHPIERADVLELSPEVIEAAELFAADHHRALADPRARIIAGDGRTHLMLGRTQYDVIISEPSNPWVAGVASLFTREFFEAARRRLAAGGILCQWAHTYDIRPADLRSIVATFASVFPHGTLWLVGAGDLLLIGSDRSLDGEWEEVAARMRRAGVAADLSGVGVEDASSLLSMYVGGPAELRTFAGDAVLQSDDKTALEFTAPMGLYSAGGADNTRTLRELGRTAESPRGIREAVNGQSASTWKTRGKMHLQAEAYDAAYDAYGKAQALAPDDDAALDGLVRAAAGAGEESMAAVLTLLREQVAKDTGAIDVGSRVALSRVFAARGDTAQAIDTVTPLPSTAPSDPRPIEQLASLFADSGDLDRLKPLAEQLRRQWPDRPSSPYYTATVFLLGGRAAEAIGVAESGVRRHPSDARLRNALGIAYASTGRRDEARQTLEDALDRDPRDASTYTNLGLIDLETGQTERAVARLGEALLLDPSSPRALGALAEALERLGHVQRAAKVRAAIK